MRPLEDFLVINSKSHVHSRSGGCQFACGRAVGGVPLADGNASGRERGSGSDAAGPYEARQVLGAILHFIMAASARRGARGFGGMRECAPAFKKGEANRKQFCDSSNIPFF